MKLEEEQLIFDKLKLASPDPTRKYSREEIFVVDGNKKFYKLFSWMSIDGQEHLIPAKAQLKHFSKHGLTSQIYYDVLILGIYNVQDRPICRCGNPRDFVNISVGYREFCSKKCAYKYYVPPEAFRHSQWQLKGKKRPPEVVKKIVEARKGYRHSPETIAKIKRNAQLGLNRTGMHNSPEHRARQREAALRRIARDPAKALENFNRNRKIGHYKPKKADSPIRYLSSWELKFMELCDLSSDVVHIDTVESIPYNLDGKDHLYIPDFKLLLSNGQIVIVEIKPKRLEFVPKNLAKRIAGHKYSHKKGYKYIVLTENELFKKSNKSYFSIFDYLT